MFDELVFNKCLVEYGLCHVSHTVGSVHVPHVGFGGGTSAVVYTVWLGLLSNKDKTGYEYYLVYCHGTMASIH
jgi:hypothetical protein